MNVAVVVPLALHCEHRERAWNWVRTRYEQTYPEWEIVTGTVEGEWSKGAAVADALSKTDAQTLIVADADVWSDNLAPFVESVVNGRRWATPHSKVFRFTEEATATIVGGGQPLDLARQRGTLVQTPYTALLGGGIVIIDRDLYDECPLDPRFVGWGGEDGAWGFALVTIGGMRKPGTHPLWHLWHPPAERLNRKIGSEENETLRARYQAAAGNGELTKALIEEGRWASKTSSSHR